MSGILFLWYFLVLDLSVSLSHLYFLVSLYLPISLGLNSFICVLVFPVPVISCNLFLPSVSRRSSNFCYVSLPSHLCSSIQHIFSGPLVLRPSISLSAPRYPCRPCFQSLSSQACIYLIPFNF